MKTEFIRLLKKEIEIKMNEREFNDNKQNFIMSEDLPDLFGRLDKLAEKTNEDKDIQYKIKNERR